MPFKKPALCNIYIYIYFLNLINEGIIIGVIKKLIYKQIDQAVMPLLNDRSIEIFTNYVIRKMLCSVILEVTRLFNHNIQGVSVRRGQGSHHDKNLLGWGISSTPTEIQGV